jgi:acyl-CoA thioester hydrolase
MARLQLSMPERYAFSAQIPVRIYDVNYGNHLGNDAIVSIMQEARLQFLKSIGCSELDLFGASLIQADTAVVYKSEGFYGDVLTVQVQPTEFTRAGFDLYYLITNQHEKAVAHAKTGMVCFDYTARKIVAVPEKFVSLFDQRG